MHVPAAATASSAATRLLGLAMIDIAVNLTDCVFRGIDWKGRRIHENDFDEVLRRAQASGVTKILVSGTNLYQCERAVKLCRMYPGLLYCTVGVHPAHCGEFLLPMNYNPSEVDPFVEPIGEKAAPTLVATPADAEVFAQQRLDRLVHLVEDNRDVVLAVGEIGLDDAELSMCPSDVQQHFFAKQLEVLAVQAKLPLFLHSRDCGMRFVEAMRAFIASPVGKGFCVSGVVHSFNGPPEELQAILDMGLHVGLNGSAFRTEELARQCVEGIPLARLMLETDAPWCDIRRENFGFQFVRTHFDATKRGKPFVVGKCLERRNEPCHLRNVMEVYCGCRTHFGAPRLTGPDSSDEEEMLAVGNVVHDTCVAVFNFPLC